MTKNGKTYRFTVKLRKKPLQGGRFSLILDYYNGNVEYLSEEQRGERIRQHLGLYLIPENTPEAKLTNEKTMKLAMEILEEKKAELEDQKKNGLHPIVKKSKDEPVELPSSLARSSNTVAEQLMVYASKCVINNINTISIHIGQRKIKDNRMSLAKLLDKISYVDDLLGIKADRRLIKNEYLRIAYQCLCNSHSLLVAL